MMHARPRAGVAACVLAAVAAFAVEAEAQALRPVSDKSARKVTLKPYKGGQRAQLELAVRSGRRGGRIFVTFTSARLRRPLGMRDARTLRLPRPRLTLASPAGARPRIRGRDRRVLRIELHLPAGAAASKLDGLLVARIGRRGPPLVVPLKGQAASPGTLTFDQDGVTVVSTHDRPFDEGKEDTTETGPMHVTGGATQEQGQLAATIIEAGDGKEARVELRAPGKTASALKETTLRVTETDGAGEYTGKLSLPAEDGKAAEALDVTLRVQDRWWFPLIVLLLGALLGGGGSRWYELHRGRELLKAELKRGVAAYGEAQEKASGVAGLKTLDEEIGDTTSWPSWLKCRFGTDKPTAGARKLYCQVSTARTAEDLEDAKRAVDALLGKINRWRQLDHALRQLKVAVAAAQRTNDAPAADGQTVLDQDEIPLPADDAASTSLATAIEGQAAAIVLYDQALPLWQQIAERYDELDPNDRAAFARYNPAQIYDRHTSMEARSVRTTARLLEQLRIALAGLRRIEKELPLVVDADLGGFMFGIAPDYDVDARLDLLMRRGLSATEKARLFRVPVLSGVFSLVPGALAHLRPVDVRTPDQIVSDVRALDWVVFFVTMIVTTAVYMVGLYVGKSFGSWNDYVAAFGAGFLGQLAVNWALFPLARSYLPGAKPVEPPKPAEA